MYVHCLNAVQDASNSAHGRRPVTKQDDAPLKQSANAQVNSLVNIARNVQTTHFLLIVTHNLAPGILHAVVMDAASATAHAHAMRAGLALRAIPVLRGSLEAIVRLYAWTRLLAAGMGLADKKVSAFATRLSAALRAGRARRLMDSQAARCSVRRRKLATAQDGASTTDLVSASRPSIVQKSVTP
jgi:hypothetical protein